jgi:hypothetical protein
MCNAIHYSKQLCHQGGDQRASSLSGGSAFIDAFVEPSCFRELESFVHSVQGGVLEVKDTAVQIQREGEFFFFFFFLRNRGYRLVSRLLRIVRANAFVCLCQMSTSIGSRHAGSA